MSKLIVKTGLLAGAISGLGSLITVVLLHALRAFHDNIFYFFIQVVGNLILYSLPAVIGGAIAGLILGALGAFIVGSISQGKIKAQHGALYGGIAGGMLLGLLPFWFGFGGIY